MVRSTRECEIVLFILTPEQENSQETYSTSPFKNSAIKKGFPRHIISVSFKLPKLTNSTLFFLVNTLRM